MKIILSGCTGYIGGAILAQCLQNPGITSIVALSRRPLSDAVTNSKLNVIIMEDFAVYPQSVIDELSGADGCIWAIGTYSGDQAADINYPLAFARAFAATMSPQGKKFRYVHLGGALTESDQEKQLWYFQNGRRVRGLAESKVTEFAIQSQGDGLPWETIVVKPAAVLAKDGNSSWLLGCLLGSALVIRSDEVAVTMVDIVLNGAEKQVLLNRDLVVKGRQLLGRS